MTTTFLFLSLIALSLRCTIAQPLHIVSETISGSIFRYPTHVTVDQYTLQITTSTALVEFDILSMETTDNKTFTDVNRDCDSSFIDSQVFLFRVLDDTSLQLIDMNDDEGDDNRGYYGKGRRDGSLNTQDSYLIRKLTAGTYVFAVGRYPLTTMAARAGRCTESINDYSPYVCQTRRASYGNYQLTVRVQSTQNTGIIKQYANSYVGNSCNPPSVDTRPECTYSLPGNYRRAILDVCSYDRTV